MNYAEFIARKAFQAPSIGIADPGEMPEYLKPFQVDCTRWALRRGRAALFESTGLGKTRQELCFGDKVRHHASKPVLLLCPLAVAEQTISEAAKIGVSDIAYAKDQASITTSFVVSNYDRADRFDYSTFGAVICDESGILKSHESQTRIFLTEACRDVPFLLACTATPAPNDYIELGNHAEFLGVMSQKEMLSMFFVHEGSVRANANTPEWRLKGHAEKDFWRWLATWSVVVRHPRDLGYDEPGYDLPPLVKHQITVHAEVLPPEGELFAREARTLAEQISTRRSTIDARVDAAVALVHAEPNEPWLIWCGLNDEADAICKRLATALQVEGKQDRETKAATLLGFVDGKPPILVTKAGIAGHGMNWQHCARMSFVGLNHSFEALFQALRRCWRFGQTREVHAYLIASDLEGPVVANLDAKEAAFEAMYAAMAEHTAALTAAAIRGGRVSTTMQRATKIMGIPEWLRPQL